MTPAWTGCVGIVVMLVLFATRMPVAFAMTLVGTAGFAVLISPSASLGMLARSLYTTFASYDLSTVPLFVLMGQLAFNAGISRRLFACAYRFLGHVHGGLAMATVVSCTAFGAVCGSSPATAATMATVAFPEMKRFGYRNRLSAGAVAAGGGLGMIMPPSVVLIVYGVLTQQSIGALFVAGILSALLITLLFLVAIAWVCWRDPSLGPPGERSSWAERLRSLGGLVDIVVVFGVVMTGLFRGWFTPTEAAAVGAFAVLVLGLVQGQLSWALIVKSVHETLRTSAMVLFLVAGATVFGKFLAVTRIPFDVAGWIGGLALPPVLILAVIVAVYFVGGCFMDSLALVMLTIPVFYPVITGLGYDPIWFGVLIVLVTEMGVITPPVGINVYVVYGAITGMRELITLEAIFRGIVPFLAAVLAGIVLITVWPEIVLVLPRWLHP
ncbi:MAG: dicarboxylate transporter, DctM subunit [Desulfomicrobiaceae bacterium]|nr:dicarboxylate transporter, DctM subunit [Desulfomicrobiaceae bacterium]